MTTVSGSSLITSIGTGGSIITYHLAPIAAGWRFENIRSSTTATLLLGWNVSIYRVFLTFDQLPFLPNDYVRKERIVCKKKKKGDQENTKVRVKVTLAGG